MFVTHPPHARTFVTHTRPLFPPIRTYRRPVVVTTTRSAGSGVGFVAGAALGTAVSGCCSNDPKKAIIGTIVFVVLLALAILLAIVCPPVTSAYVIL